MPTLEVDFDFSQIKQRAMDLGATADQIPYIMATTLNMAAENTRSYLIETTWPSSVTVRNRSFMDAALTTKGSRATKGDLTVEIYDKIGRANLFLHAKGGTRRAKGGNLSIPSSVNVQRTERRRRADAAAAEEFAKQLQARALHLPTPGQVEPEA
ncbi:hypothetical protein A1D31_36105 [Bradyrhizobium liaoningense]|nr:hypothetical protein A1D31_36105 [Bradyrhizobium liaoningense]